jgi:hypothetical protein
MADKIIINIFLLGGFICCLSGILSSGGCSGKIDPTRTELSKTWICSDMSDKAMKQNDYQTAILLHERVLEKNPSNALALYHLGYAYGQVGEHKKEV